MMLGSKGFLTPLIPDCYVLCTPAIFKNIRNPLIFLRKMATYSCFWRVKRSKILLQASLHRLFDILTLVSIIFYSQPTTSMTGLRPFYKNFHPFSTILQTFSTIPTSRLLSASCFFFFFQNITFSLALYDV